MLKARIILGTLMMASGVGIVAVWNTGLDVIVKILLTILLEIIILASGVLLVATLTALDKQGRISRDSWFFKSLEWWYEGSKKGIPEDIKVCPTWQKLAMIAVAAHLVGVVVLIIAGFIIFLLVTIGRVAVENPIIILWVVGGIIGIVVIGRSGFFIGRSLRRKSRKISFSDHVVILFFKALYDKACLVIPIEPAQASEEQSKN